MRGYLIRIEDHDIICWIPKIAGEWIINAPLTMLRQLLHCTASLFDSHFFVFAFSFLSGFHHQDCALRILIIGNHINCDHCRCHYLVGLFKSLSKDIQRILSNNTLLTTAIAPTG
jgi:hypothetical protein